MARDKPLYPNLGSLVWHRLGQKVQGTVWHGAFCVLIPNYYARITQVRPGISALNVKVEPGTGKLSDMTLKSYVESGDVHHLDSRFVEGKPDVVVAAPNGLGHWSIVLLDREGGLIDYRSSDAIETAPVSEVGEPDEEYIRGLISRGENETVEFKPMPMGNNVRAEEKRRDLAETAIAFANTRGALFSLGWPTMGRLRE